MPANPPHRWPMYVQQVYSPHRDQAREATQAKFLASGRKHVARGCSGAEVVNILIRSWTDACVDVLRDG